MLTKIVGYKIVKGTTHHSLAQGVESALGDGFEPHGSMVVFKEFTASTPKYFQPMVMKVIDYETG